MYIEESGQEVQTLNGVRWVYNDDDDTRHEVRYEDMNNQKKFEQAVRKKGLWAWFAYTHGSAYDEDHFFYITNVPGFEGKKAAFQLRVSNHRTVMSVWEKSHSNGIASVNGNKVERKTLMADFCLNLILNPDRRQEENIDRGITNKIRVCCVDCYLKYYDYPEGGEERQKIDSFIEQIISGERPTIDYAELNSLFGRCVTRISTTKGDPEFREHNFSDRENQIANRNTFDFVVNSSNEIPKKVDMGVAIELKWDDAETVEYEGKKYHKVKYNGRDYLYDGENMILYFVNSKGKVNTKEPIPVEEGKNAIKISLNEIYSMVTSVLKHLFE